MGTQIIDRMGSMDRMPEMVSAPGMVPLPVRTTSSIIEAKAPRKELEQNRDYPLILMAGRHYPMNANTLMRNPEWNKGKRACTVAMNPSDAEKNRFTDGQLVRIITEAGSVEVELEITQETRKGQVIVPHGFGLEYDGRTYGVNINRLTKNTHRDRLAATPLHRYVPCRVEAA